MVERPLSGSSYTIAKTSAIVFSLGFVLNQASSAIVQQACIGVCGAKRETREGRARIACVASYTSIGNLSSKDGNGNGNEKVT